MNMSGAGNCDAGVTLTYTNSNGVDLTSGGSNTQLLVDFALVDQVPFPPGSFVDGVTMYINVTSGGRNYVMPLDGVGNYYAFNAAFNFALNFQPQYGNFTDVTSIAVTFEYPESGSGGGSLTVEVNKIWATPDGGAPPSMPSPTVTAPVTAVGTSTTPVDFNIAFTNGEGAAPVTYDPPSNIGVRAQDLSVSGTAFGAATPVVSVSGGPSTYNVAVSGMTQNGGITLDVPAGIVDDAWGQGNIASADDPTVAFTKAIPPSFAGSSDATEFGIGIPNAFTVNGMGGSPLPVPIPSLSISAGSLASGLSFVDNGDGTATISGTAALGTAGDDDFTLQASNVAGTVTQAFYLTITKASQAPLALTSTGGTYGTPLTLTASGGSGTGGDSYSAIDDTATGCTVNGGNQLSATSAGTCLVTATQAGDANYYPVSSPEVDVTLGADTPALSLSGTPVPGSNTYGVTLSVPSGGVAPSEDVTVTDSSSATCDAALTGSDTTYTGSCTIDGEILGETVSAAYGAGDPNYTTAGSNTLTVSIADQAALAITSTGGTYGTALTLSTMGGSGTGAITYTVIDGSATGCAISSDELTLSSSSAGTCLVTATKAGDTDYNSASSPQTTVTLGADTPTLTLSGTPVAGDNIYDVTLTVPSGGVAPSDVVTITDSSGAFCTTTALTGSDTTYTGTCTITGETNGETVTAAYGSGDPNYSAAGSNTLTVGPSAQMIYFGSLRTKIVTHSPITVHATATSDLTVIFTTTTPLVCTYGGTNGTTITLVAPGQCTVEAQQTGDSNYLAAPPVTRNFTVTQANQTITFRVLRGRLLSKSPITVAATASSGLTVTFTTTTPLVCTSNGTDGVTITMHMPGTCTVVASQVGDTTYKAAPSVSRSFTVKP
jgi:hypothetical protein